MEGSQDGDEGNKKIHVAADLDVPLAEQRAATDVTIGEILRVGIRNSKYHVGGQVITHGDAKARGLRRQGECVGQVRWPIGHLHYHSEGGVTREQIGWWNFP